MRMALLALAFLLAAVTWFAVEQQKEVKASAAAAARAEALRAQPSATPVRAIDPSRAAPVSESMKNEFPVGQAPPPARSPDPVTPSGSGFACDGRTHCSQMHSCAEAQYFLAHCPGVKMDGNHDGEPCEQQFQECGSR